MCLIVDINIAEKVFKPNDPEFCHVHSALFTAKHPPAKLVYGGKLTQEYNESEKLRRMLRVLDSMGRTRIIPDEKVDAECAAVEMLGICVSNDAHIIALARASKVRLLCTHDGDLISDFNNKSLVNCPRGKVYSCAANKGLLVQFCKNK